MRFTNYILTRFVITGSSSGIGGALLLTYAESPELFRGGLTAELNDLDALKLIGLSI